uniref:Uncharacterized protein n=2 Tax=Branchiostoma floridae TaxID=7739 RepID=C3XXC5_BRAFL|eukprot:XP_002611375.1 hypothetical protein BRAFLDRAFT_58005 [Branchiostoma floridae]
MNCLHPYLYFWHANVLLKRPKKLPPYPAGRVPVLGHLLALGRAPHLQLTVWRRQYGDVFTVRMGMEDVVVLNGYTAVKDALVDRSELFASRPQNYLLDTIVGCGKDIMSARWGTAVKQRRRFSITALKSLGMKIGTGSIEEKIKEEASYLRNKIVEYDGQAFDISNDVNVAVANIICSMVFGKRYDYGDKTFRELSESVSNVIAAMQGQIVTVFPLLRFVPGVNRSSMKALKLNSKIKALLWDEIAHHRENLDRENPRDFIDLLLLQLEQHEKVDNLTEENVMHITHNIFFAGMETTTNTLLWSLLYMTLNPGVQKKVQQELDAVIGESLPALSHRPQLPYVNACLQEVMRIRTLLPLNVPHATTQEVKVQGFDIPKGIKVFPNLYSVHMDPAYWPDPDRFDPERFLDAEGNVIDKPESFLPFSGGRRVCIGEKLARMELFLFFSTLLQSFTFKAPEGAPPTDGVVGITWGPHPFKLCAIRR